MGKKNSYMYTGNDASEENILSIYLKEINRIPLLTREQENDYATRADKGDGFAKDMLVKSNTSFCGQLAKKYQKPGLPLSDLISKATSADETRHRALRCQQGFSLHFLRRLVDTPGHSSRRSARKPHDPPSPEPGQRTCPDRKSRKNFEGLSEDQEIRDVAAYLNMDPDHVAEIVARVPGSGILDSPSTTRRTPASWAIHRKRPLIPEPENYASELNLKDDLTKVLELL
jgi:RNA polymerase primary sigma factor